MEGEAFIDAGERYRRQVDQINGLAQAIVTIEAMEIPAADITEDDIRAGDEGERFVLAQDDAWEEAWTKIVSTITECVSTPTAYDDTMSPDVDPDGRCKTVEVQTSYTSIVARLYADGDVTLVAEYATGSPWSTLYDSRLNESDADPIGLGREVASAELAILARLTGSCAATLDYWQTDSRNSWFIQSKWAGIRSVGRQTVSDNVRAVKTALDPAEVDG